MTGTVGVDGRSVVHVAPCPLCGCRVRVTLSGCLRAHCPDSPLGVMSSLADAPQGQQRCPGSRQSLAYLLHRATPKAQP